MLSRRSILRLIAAGGVHAAAWPLVRQRAAYAGTLARPRFYLQIIPQGGMDAIYSTDPKKENEVDHGIDVPFAANEIVELSGTRLGPCFRELARWMPKLAIVNAFRQNSANHVSGLAHVTRFKSSTTDETPTLLDIIGARREHEALGAISIGPVFTSGFSPTFFGEPSTQTFGSDAGLFEHLDQADPDDLVALARALRRQASTLGGARASAAEKATGENLLASAELFARVAVSPKFAPVDWTHALEPGLHCGRDLQRVLWFFENALTRCATVCVGNLRFDTHLHNTTKQPVMVRYLAFLLDKLFTELEHRMVDGRPMSEQTLIVIGSEIGRFPRLNETHGKDHFPQAPHLFYGPGIATGVSYGATGRNMASLPVSLVNGKPESTGHLLRVDDIGTTLLTLDGADPEQHGYVGKRLPFLMGG